MNNQIQNNTENIWKAKSRANRLNVRKAIKSGLAMTVNSRGWGLLAQINAEIAPKLQARIDADNRIGNSLVDNEQQGFVMDLAKYGFTYSEGKIDNENLAYSNDSRFALIETSAKLAENK